jgi:hypothetical protein
VAAPTSPPDPIPLDVCAVSGAFAPSETVCTVSTTVAPTGCSLGRREKEKRRKTQAMVFGAFAQRSSLPISWFNDFCIC